MNLHILFDFRKPCDVYRSFFHKAVVWAFVLYPVLIVTACGAETEPSVPGTVYGLSDLPGKQIGVLADSQADLYATDLELPSEQEEPSVIIRYSHLDEAVEDLKTGRLDCIIMDASSAENYCGENDHLAILEEAFSWQEYSICLGAGQTELAASLNEALAILEENGTLKEISDRYITTSNDHPAPTEEIPAEGSADSSDITGDTGASGSGRLLRVATSSGFQPYTYYDINGNLTGIDIDVACALAEYLDMDIRITDMSYESLFTSVADGTADFAIAGISPFEDPMETCIFTDTYTTACQMVLVRE